MIFFNRVYKSGKNQF